MRRATRTRRCHLGRLVLPVVLFSFAVTAALAADWPQWRGPNRDGVSSETRWNPRWGEDGPKVLWQKSVGAGYASVTVANGRLFTMGYDDRSGSDVIYCLDPQSGAERWRHAYRAPKRDKQHMGGPSCTPSVDGDRIYTMSREAVVYCLAAADGKVIWTLDLKKAHNVREGTWAFAGSPLILGDHVIFDVGKTVALDKTTGKTVWSSKNYGAAYSSPVAFDHKGKTCLAVFPESGLVVLDAADGSELGTYRHETRHGVNAATPLVLDDHIFISSGYNKGCALVKFTGNALQEVWSNRNMRNKMASAVHHNGYLYGIDDSANALVCVEVATGRQVWSQRDTGNGAVALAGDVLILITEMGELVTVEASPEGYKPLTSRAEVFRTRRAWIVPVIAHGLVYARSQEGRLVCLDLRSEEELARRDN